MAKVMPVLHYPDKRLREIAHPVAEVDSALRQLVDDMYATMYAEQGVGLAAVQVGILKRIIVADDSDSRDQPRCFINLEILERDGVQQSAEGCLSVLGAYADIERAAKVKVRAMNAEGEVFEEEYEGLMAAIMQHELDHLNGILFPDHLSRLKRERVFKKSEKLKKARL